jgi:hypothetical protein
MSTEEMEPVDVIPAGPPVLLTNTDEVLKGTVPAPYEVQTGVALSSCETDGTLMAKRYGPFLPASVGEVASAGRPVLPPTSSGDTVTPSDNTLVAVCATEDKLQRRERVARRALGITLPTGSEVILLPFAEVETLMPPDTAPQQGGSVRAAPPPAASERSASEACLSKRIRGKSKRYTNSERIRINEVSETTRQVGGSLTRAAEALAAELNRTPATIRVQFAKMWRGEPPVRARVANEQALTVTARVASAESARQHTEAPL